MIHKSFISILFSLLLILTSQLARAETQQNSDIAEQANWYTVEVISFTREKTPQMNEQWPLSSAPEDTLEATLEETLEEKLALEEQLQAQGIKPQMQNNPLDNALLADFEAVPETEWKLSRHAYSVNRARGMKVRSHQVWRQKGQSRDQSQWINLQTADEALTGKIRISLSRYLHADVDIKLLNPDWTPSFSLETPEVVTEQNIPQEIAFNTSRRLRKDRLHYIDHPLGGVLIHIERFEKSPEAKQTKQTPGS